MYSCDCKGKFTKGCYKNCSPTIQLNTRAVPETDFDPFLCPVKNSNATDQIVRRVEHGLYLLHGLCTQTFVIRA